jgi:hypothetical protein
MAGVATYGLEVVTGGLPARPRAERKKPTEQVYWGLISELYQAAGTGFFDADPNNWVSIAKFGGAGTATTTRKNLLSGKVKVPAAPKGYQLVLAARTVSENADGTPFLGEEEGAKAPVRSRLYGRLNSIPTATAGAEDDEGFFDPAASDDDPADPDQ